jgi:carbonic anhydrase
MCGHELVMKPDDLHPGLRDPWQMCETIRGDLLALLRNIPPNQWEVRPAPGLWSAAHQADHLLRAEIGTSKIVRKLIRGDFRDAAVPEGVVPYDSTLGHYPFGPVAAPAALEPEGLSASEAVERLAAAHERFFEELCRFQGKDPDTLVAPDPASPLWFSLAGWVRVQALHEAHHAAQIRKIAMRSPTPGSTGMEARVATSGPDLEEARRLFTEYAAWVAVDLSFQGFAAELAGLPGDYVAPQGVLLLGLVDALPAGCIAVRRWRPDTCEMKRLYVRPGHRGRGVGAFLAEHAIDWAIRAGYNRMVLDTLPTMGVAQALYDRLGFREVEPYRFNPVPGARFMARDLASVDGDAEVAKPNGGT